MRPSVYRPTGAKMLAWIVTRENVDEVALEVGGLVYEDSKPTDPADVAVWLRVPLLTGTTDFLVTEDGPVVGREVGTNRLRAWKSKAEFLKRYEQVSDEH